MEVTRWRDEEHASDTYTFTVSDTDLVEVNFTQQEEEWFQKLISSDQISKKLLAFCMLSWRLEIQKEVRENNVSADVILRNVGLVPGSENNSDTG